MQVQNSAEFCTKNRFRAYTFSMSDLKIRNTRLSKKELKRELVWFGGCALVCFLIGGSSAFLGTTEDHERMARREGEAVNHQAMYKAANQDFWFYGAVFAFSAIPIYAAAFGVRRFLLRFRNEGSKRS